MYKKVVYNFLEDYNSYLIDNGFNGNHKRFEGEILYHYYVYKKHNIEITISDDFNFGRAGNSVVFNCIAGKNNIYLQVEVDDKSLNLSDYYPDRLKKLLESNKPQTEKQKVTESASQILNLVQPEVMKQFEYKRIDVMGSDIYDEDTMVSLNALGKDGWELISDLQPVLNMMYGGQGLFKREIMEEKQWKL